MKSEAANVLTFSVIIAIPIAALWLFLDPSPENTQWEKERASLQQQVESLTIQRDREREVVSKLRNIIHMEHGIPYSKMTPDFSLQDFQIDKRWAPEPAWKDLPPWEEFDPVKEDPR